MNGLAIFLLENLISLIEEELAKHAPEIQKFILNGLQAELAKGMKYIEDKLAHKV